MVSFTEEEDKLKQVPETRPLYLPLIHLNGKAGQSSAEATKDTNTKTQVRHTKQLNFSLCKPVPTMHAWTAVGGSRLKLIVMLTAELCRAVCYCITSCLWQEQTGRECVPSGPLWTEEG